MTITEHVSPPRGSKQQPSPTWHFIVADTNGNALGEITEATMRQISFVLRDSCSASFTMDAVHSQAGLIVEGETDLLLYRNNVLMFRGRLGSSQDTLGSPGSGGGGGTDPDAHTAQFSAVDYRAMLGYRIIRDPDVTYTAMDQAAIAWQMILTSMSRPGGNWGLVRGVYTPSVVRTLTETAGTVVGQAITDISNMDAGFDWEIDAHLAFNAWPTPAGAGATAPGRGVTRSLVLTYGDNVMAALRSKDMTQYANALRYAGSGSIVSNTDIIAAGLATGWPPEGRWEAQESNTNITDQTSNDAAAKGDLIVKSLVIPAYTLTLTHGWWDPTVLWLGDTVNLNVAHGRLNEAFNSRVTEVDIYIGDDASEETAVVTVGRRMGSLLRTIPGNSKKMEQIAKRV